MFEELFISNELKKKKKTYTIVQPMNTYLYLQKIKIKYYSYYLLTTCDYIIILLYLKS